VTEPATDHSPVATERRGSTLVVTLDRPEARNAFDLATRRDLARALRGADADPDVRSIVLTGRDPAFSGGVDLKEALGKEGYVPPRANPAQILRSLRTPVIAAVNGSCVSGALEVALACAFVLASDQARFADTHARVGLLPSWGLSAALPQAIGVRRARQMTLTGDFIDAPRAYDWGLVNEVVPHDRLVDRAVEIGASIEGVADGTARAALDLYVAGEGASLTTALGLEAEAHAAWHVDPGTASERFRATTKRGRRPSS
jgi:enoyl-CoA hydratase